MMRDLDDLRRDLIANVSHELRTPVAVIRANAETLLEGALADPVASRRFVEAIERNATRLTNIISELLDLSRIETGNYPLERRSLRLDKAVSRAIDVVEELAKKRDVRIETQLDPTALAFADKRGLDQILINLLDNAIKYTPTGGQVWIRTSTDARGVRIEVEDHGPGVDPRHRDRIFERFFRGEGSRSRDKNGTGLGLAIVKHLTNLMNGLVGVKSGASGASGALGASGASGALFWLVLPRPESGTQTEANDHGEVGHLALPGRRPHTGLSPEEEALERDLRRVRFRLARMASRVVEVFDATVRVLLDRSAKQARYVLRLEEKINRDEVKCDAICYAALDLHRPKATDLRFIGSTLKVVTDLEQIGNLCVGICRRILENPVPKNFSVEVEGLVRHLRQHLRNAIDSLIDGEVEKARIVLGQNEVRNEAYRDPYSLIANRIRTGKVDPRTGMQLVPVIEAMARLDKHATSIAEQVVFLVEGRDVRHISKGG